MRVGTGVRVALVAVALSVGVSGCVGEIGDGGARESSTVPAEPASALPRHDLRRLTRLEYEQTLRDLFGDDVVDEAGSALAQMPTDRVEHGFRTMSLGVTANYVDGSFYVADAVSDALTADAAALAKLEPCLADAPDENCIEGFFDRLGRRIYRRPLGSDDRQALLAAYDDGLSISVTDGLKLMLMQMLISPRFLYRIELAGALAQSETLDDEHYPLDEYELATRLAYFAWGTTPDEELLDAAADGRLSGELDSQVERLFSDPRAEQQVARFADEWLGLEFIPSPDQSDLFLGEVDGVGLSQDARTSARELVLHHAFAAQSSYSELLETRSALPLSEDLATIYELDASAQSLVQLDPKRTGLFTRVALLLAGGEQTHPIVRGAELRRRFLCDETAPPEPENIEEAIEPPPFDANKTARQRWTEQTSGKACVGCHSMINPFGFALESFDNLGRYRELEPIADPSSGELLAELPIDTGVIVHIDGQDVSVDGAADLSRAVSASADAQRCFSESWFRFAHGRDSELSDGAVIGALQSAGETGSMLELMKAYAQTPQFQLRRVRRGTGDQ